MTSFGKRLKTLRRACDMTQENLAEAIGVSIQSISKWEGDYNMPDVSMIVPLAKILNVTTDCLLGMDVDEEEEKIKLLDKTYEIMLLDPSDESYTAQKMRHRELLKKFVEKYPLDFSMQFRYAEYSADVFDDIKRGLIYLDGDTYNELFADVERTLKRIINQDKDTERLIKARRTLCDLYAWTNRFDDAENAALELPAMHGIRDFTLMHIATCAGDNVRALNLAEKAVKLRAEALMGSLFYRARQTSVFGNVRKREAIEKFNDLKNFAKLYESMYHGSYPECLNGRVGMMDAVEQLANCHFAINEVDAALSCVEEVTSLAEDMFSTVRRNETDPKRLERCKVIIKTCLVRCYNWLFAEDDNVFTKEPRFQKCIERIDALAFE